MDTFLAYPLMCLPILILLTILLYRYCRPTDQSPRVVAVAVSRTHNFTKSTAPSINLLKGLGVEGDAHLGETVQHRSRLHIQPPPANLRQVHLIAIETLKARDLRPGDIGENIATQGIDLLSLPEGTRLHFVAAESTKSHLSQEGLKSSVNQAENCPCVVVRGLRNPCPQIERFRSGLQEHFFVRDQERKIIGRKAGVMGTVKAGGYVKPGMEIIVELPDDRLPVECM